MTKIACVGLVTSSFIAVVLSACSSSTASPTASGDDQVVGGGATKVFECKPTDADEACGNESPGSLCIGTVTVTAAAGVVAVAVNDTPEHTASPVPVQAVKKYE